jgi:hypothetical protein
LRAAGSGQSDLLRVSLDPGDDRFPDDVGRKLRNVEVADESSVHDRWQHLEHADAARLQFGAERTRERVHRRLRRRVDAEARNRRERDGRRDVDNGGVSGCSQQGQGQARHANGTQNVGLDVLAALRGSVGIVDGIVAQEAGIVD